MKLATIEMPQQEAQEAFAEYRRAVRSAKTAQTNTEDAQIARCYKALAVGNQVIDLLDVMQKAGEDQCGLPKLAISRADFEHARMYRDWLSGTVEMGTDRLFPSWNRRSGADYSGELFRFVERFTVRRGVLKNTRGGVAEDFTAIVPNIPPSLRPPHDLKNYHLLWEASWEVLRIPRTSPRDPALLKHLGGPLYAVLATWDLTPVEQAVLGVTRN